MRPTLCCVLFLLLFSACDRDSCDCEPDVQNYIWTEAFVELYDLSGFNSKVIEDNVVGRQHLGIGFYIIEELEELEVRNCPCRDPETNYSEEYITEIDVYFNDVELGGRENVNDRLYYEDYAGTISFAELEYLINNEEERLFRFRNSFRFLLFESEGLPDQILVEVVVLTSAGNTFRSITEEPLLLL